MSTTTHRRSLDSTDTVSKFHAEAPQATASEELVQGPYVATRDEFEAATLWTKGTESTNEPSRPTIIKSNARRDANSLVMFGVTINCFKAE